MNYHEFEGTPIPNEGLEVEVREYKSSKWRDEILLSVVKEDAHPYHTVKDVYKYCKLKPLGDH